MKAAELIWNSWKNGKKIETLPDEIMPHSRNEAYKIQEQIEVLSKNTILGWKIAATSKDGQNHIGVSGPLAGRIFREKVTNPNNTIALGNNKMGVAEPEFAFKIGSLIKPNKTLFNVEEIMELVDTLHLAIEFPDSRFNNFSSVGELSLIADNACADQFVISSPIEKDWKNIDFSNFKLSISNSKFSYQGIGSNVLGDPRIALTWLVNELSQNNIMLEKGMIVSTGTCSKPIPVETGDIVTANFGELGEISINLK